MERWTDLDNAELIAQNDRAYELELQEVEAIQRLAYAVEALTRELATQRLET